ncbi:MAG TPA: hypothetical protein DEA32_02810 [Firmicutes bacterium]|nr:hypothetical protein [Bacillota bacterium]
MEKAVLVLQYRDYPLWTVDEESGLKMPGLPAYLSMPDGLEEKLDRLQEMFDALFGMDGEAMSFKGIPDEKYRSSLSALAEECVAILRQSYPTLEIDNRIPKVLLSCKVIG